jgi:hypothetical protein
MGGDLRLNTYSPSPSAAASADSNVFIGWGEEVQCISSSTMGPETISSS